MDTALIQTLGYMGVAILAFGESGLFIGAFLPGDTVLISSGLLATQGYFSYILLILCAFPASVVGDCFAYIIGEYIGPKIFRHENSTFFNKESLNAAHAYFKKYGIKTILFARFIPFVRSATPLAAGADKMTFGKFLLWDSMGAFIWAFSLITVGFTLGRIIPNVGDYLLVVITGIIFICIAVPVINALFHEKSRTYMTAAFRKLFRRLKRSTF